MSKVVVVTGATSGMGKATIERLSGRGYKCFGTAFGLPPELRTESYLASLPYRLIDCDITDDASVESFVGQVLDEAGRIDVLINCAGFGFGGGIEDSTVEEAKMQFEVNFFGTHRITRAVMPAMRRQGGGRILTVSSLASIFTVPFQAFYSASKAALDVMMNAVRMEGRTYGITACTVNPGDVRSGFTGNRKQAAACSPGSPYYELSMRSINRMKRDEMAGMAPEVVADLLCRLVEVRRLKPRYIIEPKYKFLVFLKRFLPDSVVEKLLMGIYLAPSKETRSGAAISAD